MNTKQKGQLAELKVAAKAAEKGWAVSIPVNTARYDLILDAGDKLFRAQVKYAGGGSKSIAKFNFGNGSSGPQCYTKDEIDVVLVYLPQLDDVVWLGPELFHNKYGLHIRLEPAKNNQSKGIFLAEDHLWR